MKQIHFIGIGGVGMSALAELALRNGNEVSGSDVVTNSYTRHLQSLGASIYYGHDGENLSGSADLVVYSSAISEDNPEMRRARSLGISVINRGEYLARVQTDYETLAVAGAHGKTSTSSMLAWILRGQQLDINYLIGGKLLGSKSNCCLGDSRILIVETDESDGSFLHFAPQIAIITCFDNEHLNFYGTVDRLKDAFRSYAQSVNQRGGRVIFNGDDPVLREIIATGISVGFDKINDYIIDKNEAKVNGFSYLLNQSPVSLPLLGDHMILNSALALVASGFVSGSIENNGNHLSSFPGVARRLELLRDDKICRFYSDYAHHPTEVRETIKALRSAYPKEKITVVYQPHRYSRTEATLDEYRGCFGQADEVMLGEIYSGGEASANVAELNQRLFSSIAHENKRFSNDLRSLIQASLQGGEIVVCMGAGDIDKIARECLQ